MRVPSWFNWRASGRDASWHVYTPQARTDDEIFLALRLIPQYRVLLSVDDPQEPLRLWWPLGWRATLTASLGAERAQRALSDAVEYGFAVLAVCPREVAEHYRNELARYALPCVIEPA